VPPTTKLVNLSARSWVGTGNSRAIVGFTIGGGGGAKRVLLRAIGPTLAAFGVRGVLAAPRLALTTMAGTLIAANDNWDAGDDAGALDEAFRASGAFALPKGVGDAATIAWLSQGCYTVLIDGADGATGVALAEIYDLDPTASVQLLNLSGRAVVRSGDDALIAGYVVAGEDSMRVLVRAIGPALRAFGLADALLRPHLQVQRSDGVMMAASSGWSLASNADELASAFAQTGAFSLDRGTADAATLVHQRGGIYTATAHAATGDSGIALVELYALP
jgi:hypothetical protein